ncbi:hypothetical protein BDZ85DRAFT_107182 [Elsinoe ampelina]|uniref:Uncharacterized protein n=1 Tax=Elsinoe ampelina TaxID=302913 RepID=A0A6A6GC56_9PEZI|nr:hypothetical protein BDZ85DRAFT_107182 [Elsinoe ampelina]
MRPSVVSGSSHSCALLGARSSASSQLYAEPLQFQPLRHPQMSPRPDSSAPCQSQSQSQTLTVPGFVQRQSPSTHPHIEASLSSPPLVHQSIRHVFTSRPATRAVNSSLNDVYERIQRAYSLFPPHPPSSTSFRIPVGSLDTKLDQHPPLIQSRAAKRTSFAHSDF